MDPNDLIDQIIKNCKSNGASDVDVVVGESVSVDYEHRLGKQEGLERSESKAVRLRVLIGKKEAATSSTDLSKDSLNELVQRTCSMAKHVPDNPSSGIADEDKIFNGPWSDLDLYDPAEPDISLLTTRAAEGEEAALAVKGISNSGGAGASWNRSQVSVGLSNGFRAYKQRTNHSLYVHVMAGSETGMEQDYDGHSTTHGEDLRDATDIGKKAGERAVKKLNPQKGPTCKAHVIFDNRMSPSLLSSFASAINGQSIARGTSFLKDKLAQHIFANNINIYDDPLRIRGHASRLFDAEGIQCHKRALIQQGELTGWILDLASARQLNLETTGSASGAGAVPHPSTSNLYIEAGHQSPENLMAEIGTGLLVTGLMGMGVNLVTGDYSRGCNGFWIENGEIAYAVTEMTIAGHLSDIMMNIVPADDLKFHSATSSPTLYVGELSLGGN